MIHSIPIKNPSVIARLETPKGTVTTESKTQKGMFVRCFPKTSRDIMTMQMLIHNEEKFAPAEGNGVLVELTAFHRYFPFKPTRP